MSDHRNVRLRTARESTPSRVCPGQCLSRSELAFLVNEHVLSRHGVASGIDRKYIGRLEAGKVSWPNVRYREAFREILGAGSDADLGFVAAHLVRAATPVDADLLLPWTLDGARAALTAVSEVDPMDRRAFLQLSSAGLAKLAFDWLVELPPASAAGTGGLLVSPEHVDVIDHLTDNLRRMDDRLGGGDVIGLARAQVQVVAGLLKNGRYSDAIGRRLHASAAELLRFAGWLSWDQGNYSAAQHHWAAALRAAHAAGDDQVGANVLAFWACQVLEAGSPSDALALTAAAQLKLKGSPRVAAIVALCRAEAAGVAGEAVECHRAIEVAHDSLAQGVPGPSWSYWVDADLYEMTGYALIRLGELDAGIERVQRSVDVSVGRERARKQAFLARGYARLGEPERAAAIGVDTLELLDDGDVVSPRCVQLLHNVRDDLRSWRIPEVTEFTDRLGLLV